MARARSEVVPAEIRTAQQRFARWRAGKQPRERIPQRLWGIAAKLCGTHSVHRVARWLRLNHTALTDQIGRRSRPRRSKTAPTFLEWRAPAGMFPGAGGAEYILEVQGTGERSLRIRARGATVSEVAALARALASGRNEG